MKSTSQMDKILNGTCDRTKRILIGVGGLVAGTGLLCYALETSSKGDAKTAMISGICALMASSLTLYKPNQ